MKCSSLECTFTTGFSNKEWNGSLSRGQYRERELRSDEWRRQVESPGARRGS